MKYRRSALVVAVTFSCLTIFSNSARADIQVDSPNVDLGEIKVGKLMKHTFCFRNDGDVAIELTDARPSCGCLAPRLSKTTLGPGESGELTLEINTLSQPAGRNVWTVTVTHRSAMGAADTAMRLTAKLIREIDVEPTAITLLSGTTLAHEISIADRRPKPLTLRAVECSSKNIAAKILDPETDATGRRVCKLRVQLTRECPEGRHDETVAIHTDDSEYPVFKIPITLVKQSMHKLQASPNKVTLVAFIGQAIPSRMVAIRSPANESVMVDRITTDDPAVLATWAPGPGTMATVKVSIERSRMKGNTLKSTVYIHTRGPNPETVIIPVVCELQ